MSRAPQKRWPTPLPRTLRAAALGAALLPALALGQPATPPAKGPAPKAAAAAQASARPRKSYTIQQFLQTTKVAGASFSPDEQRILFSSNETGIFNAYTVPVKGGKPTALTRSKKDTTYAVAYFPQDERILYTRDAGGDENNHLYVREKSGKERDLTPATEGKKLKAMFMGWAPDDASFFVATNERDPRFFDVYRYAAKDYARTRIFENTQSLQLADISDDGRWVALAKMTTTSDSDIFLYDTKTGETKNITAHQGSVSNRPSAFDPRGEALYYLSDEGREFTRVRRHVLATGKVEEVEQAEWDVMYTAFSKKGRYRVSAVNADARTVLSVHDTTTGQKVALPALPAGDVTSVTFSPSETKFAFYVNGDRSPSNLFVHDLKTGTTTQLTRTLARDVDPEDLVEAEVVRFKSFDGMAIPNVLWKPHQATEAAKAPALVWVHGGPGGQTRKGYSAMIQYLVNHGYVVLGINNRGSSGYGKTFYTADDGKHGAEPLWDCVEAKKYLQSLPYVDAQRVGIIGGSYGGYMTLAALAFKPEEFAVGVDIFGVSNWLRTLESIPPYWEAQRQALYQEVGDPKKDAERLRATSPLFHADKIKRPLLVIQGANDPRVIKPESDDIVNAVKKNGVPVEYVVFPDEGHGFSKRVNEEAASSAILKFLNQHLRAQARN